MVSAPGAQMYFSGTSSSQLSFFLYQIDKLFKLLCKPGGLDLSQSWHWQSWSRQSKNFNTFKKCVLTVKKSRSRSRLLNFVLTSMSRPKCLDWDREICGDLKIFAFLDSLSRSQLRVCQFYHISRSRFLYLSRFLGLMYLKKSQKCQYFSTNLAASRQILLRLNKSR